MENFLFATLLFCLYFCFVCCQFFTPHTAQATPKAAKLQDKPQRPSIGREIGTEPIAPATLTLESSDLPPRHNIPEPEIEEDITDDEIGESPDAAGAIIAIRQLTKRQLRKLCAPLQIQQSCRTPQGRVELSKQLMLEAVLNSYQTNPDKAIQIIQTQLPELVKIA
jgi:hypothetical protein